MAQRIILGLAVTCALLSTSVAGAATLTNHPDESAFLNALGPDIALTSENWDGFADDTVIDTQVPGVTFSSPNVGRPVRVFYTSRATSPPAILSGGFAENGRTSQAIVAEFSPATTALAFTVVAQHPEALDIQMLFEFTDGTDQSVPLPDNDGTNANREFFGVTSDTPILRVTHTTNEQSGGLFQKFGGWDDLSFGTADTLPPICLDEPAFRGSVLGVEVTCTDDRPGDTGIVSVELSADADNLSLTVDPFIAPAPQVTFFVAQIDAATDGEATITTTDGAGNADVTPTNFRVLPGGVVVNEILCDREGVVLSVTNDNADNPAALTSCSGSGVIGEPRLPFGYEPLPNTLVLTIDSGITGDTTAELDIEGPFEPRMRALFANSEDGGLTFSDFRDLTRDVVPGTTRVGTLTGKWSAVKYAYVIQAEICDGVDNDGDGLIDEGFEQPLVECVTEPADPAVCDADGDGFYVCGDPAGVTQSAGFDNVDCADQLDFIYPAAAELCNGLDDDCNGVADDGDPGGGEACPITGQFGICSEGATSCEQGQVVCSQTVFPGDLDEVCDGIDNDCDGISDEPDTVDALTWYADADGDGFGDPAMPRQACDQPEGFVPDDTDCDDASAATHPGAEEFCDGFDNDCDGLVDEPDAVGAPTWYADADGDGFGDPDAAQVACTPAAGFVADDTDCDDASAATNPGAREVCDDADNDCDGTVDDFVCVWLGGYLVEIVSGPEGEFPVADGDGNSVFAYKISGRGALGQSCAGVRSLSHADILVPVCDPDTGEPVIDILGTDPGSELLRDGIGDPSTGFGTGDTENDVLKWLFSLRCQEVRTVSLKASGEIGAGLTEFLIKSGKEAFAGSIGGPGCTMP